MFGSLVDEFSTIHIGFHFYLNDPSNKTFTSPPSMQKYITFIHYMQLCTFVTKYKKYKKIKFTNKKSKKFKMDKLVH